MNIKNIKGFALIDVIVAIILVGAISAASVSYVYKNNSLTLANASCTQEWEFYAHAFSCAMVVQLAHASASDGLFTSDTDINECLTGSTITSLGGSTLSTGSYPNTAIITVADSLGNVGHSLDSTTTGLNSLDEVEVIASNDGTAPFSLQSKCTDDH